MGLKSELEALFAFQMKATGIPDPVSEYRFHPTRKWRFDFAWPDRWVAVEVEGGTWSGGRHTRGGGFQKDCEKYNNAALLGWIVLRFTKDMIEIGQAIGTLERALSKEMAPEWIRSRQREAKESAE